MSDVKSIKLAVVPGLYGLVRLPPAAEIPEWFKGPGLTAAVGASDELTLLCLQDRIPEGLEVALDWRCFRSLGPFAFDATGIVLSLIQPLSTAGIGIFVVCTFDGEHLLVQDKDWPAAQALLRQAGHVFSA